MNRQKQVEKLCRWLIVIVLFCLIFPVRYDTIKLSLLLSLTGLWFCLLYLFRQKRLIVIFCVLPVAIGTIILPLPDRPTSSIRLREEYVRSLRTYHGTYYIWGGGNHLGIDCSGLVQTGFSDANFRLGVRTGNPKLIRDGFSLWWHNCSARALGDGYRNETYLLATAPSLNQVDYTQLLPGDFAVTEDGTHTLAHTGNRGWIEAEPRIQHVIELTAPQADIYFNEPVRLMRWRQFDNR